MAFMRPWCVFCTWLRYGNHGFVYGVWVCLSYLMVADCQWVFCMLNCFALDVRLDMHMELHVYIARRILAQSRFHFSSPKAFLERPWVQKNGNGFG